MSFDQGPNEQSQISEADFSMLVDELKSLRIQRDELLTELKQCTAMIIELGMHHLDARSATFREVVLNCAKSASVVILKFKNQNKGN